MELLVKGEDTTRTRVINRGGQTNGLRDGTFELHPAKPR